MDSGLARFVRPATIALIGGREAENAVRQCQRLGYQGELWPVNPERTEMAGCRVFPSVEALPHAPDAALVAVNREATIDVVASLARMGAGGAVCYASGFAEAGPEGAKLQDELLRAAGDMPIQGPNCYGFINALEGVALWPDTQGCQPVERGVAVVTQSGNIGLNLTMQKRGIPISHLITVGNQAAIDAARWMHALLDDERVAAIGLHLEAIIDSAAFADAAMRAHDQQVPLVALKAGTSPAGAEIALSHTGSIAGNEAAYSALFRRYGIYRVRTLPAFLEALSFLETVGPLPGNRLAAMCCSGGEASLLADRVVHFDVEFPSLPEENEARIAGWLSDLVAISNPLDYHTFIWGQPRQLAGTFQAMLDGPFDAGILALDFPLHEVADDESWLAAADAAAESGRAAQKPVAVVASLPENMPADVSARLRRAGVAALHGIDESLSAIDAAAWIGSFRPTGPHHPVTGIPEGTRRLSESEGKELLAGAAIPVPTGRTVVAALAPASAEELGYPVAVKAVGPAHKTEGGGVATALRRREEVEQAVASIGTAEVLVEQHIEGGVAELLVGIRREPPIGYLLTIAAGGVAAELHHDAVHLLLDAEADVIRQELGRLRTFPLLDGYRGAIAGDVDAVVAAAVALSQLALSRNDVIELEINPLLVLPAGSGVVAVDALVRLDSADA